MAILAVYPNATTLQVAVWDDARYEQSTFPLSSSGEVIIEQQLMPWLSKLGLTEHELQFIVTNGHLEREQLGDIHMLDDSLVVSEFTRLLANHLGISVYVIDPSASNECQPEAYVTGTPALQRRCKADTFVFKYLVRQEAMDKKLDLDEEQFIALHLDDENQLGALRGTKILESLTSFDEGPFSLRHSGALPFDSVLDLCMEAENKEQVLNSLHHKGGLSGYLGIENLEELWGAQGEQVDVIREALVYQISKEVGALAAVLQGKVQGILLAGNLVKHEPFVEALKKRIGFIAPISIYPGNQMLPALLAGAEKILEQT